ncbi:hypothetical protein BG015_007148 [Linnemannia schmuckeri]|uniref:Something about silencing protein 4 domain-containing protein n=1 Tax=Linnemannia schmuckeri TaxID=64567 RepID=A0A9P5S1L2_9FUNG|nr:hypothetical protein BG015_007148 [Linnemannia schmuckeri]
MKTDRKVDPVSSATTTSTTTASPRRHPHTHTHESNNAPATKTPTTNSSGDSKHEKGADGEEEYVIAVSGRKKRVLVSPRPSQQQQQQQKQQQQEDTDLDMNSDVDVVTVDEVVSRKKKSDARSSLTASVVSDPAPPVETVITPSSNSRSNSNTNKSSKRSADTTATTITSTAAKAAAATVLVAEPCPASKESGKVNRSGTSTDSEHQPTPTTSTQPLTAKKSRKSLTAPSRVTTKSNRSKSTAVAAPTATTTEPTAAPTPATPANAKATSPLPPTTPAAAGSGSDAAPQKRVLPSRGGMLRDKNTIPIEPSLLEPPPVPAGEYILYLADQQTFQRTTLDSKRVPLASYGGTENVIPAESSTSSTSSTATAQPTLPSASPPSATTHIEVPIFKLCSITQFLQEEKKRKMQLLTKALAKAEADAAEEAKALSQSDITPSATPRAVSTRQKHKAIVNNQQVSVQTAVPSFFSSSSTKKATTTNTTVGKIEGAVGAGGVGGGSSAGQEENLSDEVYEKRHRKQEMAEKKLKNREKEKLRHAMYQQQLVVEKLRHMEVNRLMPISAFRSLQKTVELEEQLKEASAGWDNTHHHHSSNNISLAAAKIMQDEYHRRLLQEAEENLRRYEQLGLADSANVSSAPAYSPFSRTKNRLISMTTGSDGQEQASISGYAGASSDKKERSTHSHSDGLVANERRRKRLKTIDVQSDDAQDSTTPQRRRKKLSASPAGAIPIARKSQTKASVPAAKPIIVVEPPRPPKPITTFIKPGSILASGSRKSYRVTLAFGEKVPALDRIDFDLPMDLFGDIIRERFGDAEPALQPVKGSGLKNKNQSARRAVLGEIAKATSSNDGTKDTQPGASESSSKTSSAPLSVSPPPFAT